MNKHTLQTKLNSIVHYNTEITKLQEALNVTKSTFKDLLDSLKDEFPFESGDVLIDSESNFILKLDSISGVSENSNNNIYFQLNVFYPNEHGSFTERTQTKNIYVAKLNNWKKIN